MKFMDKLLPSLIIFSAIFFLGCLGGDDSNSDSFEYNGIELELDSDWDVSSSDYNALDDYGYISFKYERVIKFMNLSFVNSTSFSQSIESKLSQKKSELDYHGTHLGDGNVSVYGHIAKFIVYNISKYDSELYYEYYGMWYCNSSQRRYTIDYRNYYIYSTKEVEKSTEDFLDILDGIKCH